MDGRLLFWVIAAALTVIVTLTVLWPLFRKRDAAAPPRAAYDMEVFGAQLRELDGDAERGAILPAEAASARAEIGRRVLKAAAEAASDGAAARPHHRRTLAASALLVGLGLPIASLLFYDRVGSPLMPDLPIAARLATDPAKADLPTLMAEAEAKLRRDPADGAGWDLLGRIYLKTGRADEAANAIDKAIRLLGATAERETSLGEARTQKANGEVTEVAKANFLRALTIDPGYLPAKFFLALDLSQEGRFAEAAPAWKALVDASPKDAPWLGTAALALEDVRGFAEAARAPMVAAGSTPPSAAVPTSADVAAAAAMSGAERKALIEGMVAQLATRLQAAPEDIEGWKRLMQSYAVLGDRNQAEAAFRQAEAVFPEASPEHGALSRFAATLGLPAARETTTR